jgi:hypothetical protein
MPNVMGAPVAFWGWAGTRSPSVDVRAQARSLSPSHDDVEVEPVVGPDAFEVEEVDSLHPAAMIAKRRTTAVYLVVLRTRSVPSCTRDVRAMNAVHPWSAIQPPDARVVKDAG